MRNKYAGTCFRCGCHVEAGKGHPHRDYVNNRWLVVCIPCVMKYRVEKERRNG